MHKVVIERPRWNPGPGKQGRRANLPLELLPKFEGIKRLHIRRKGLTDLLGPLKRWLQSQVGRPWNDVYSEACAVIKPDSVIRLHVKTHLLQFVQRHTFMYEGRVCFLDTSRRGGIVPVRKMGRCRNFFFVHPETGLLHESPSLSKREWKARPPKEKAMVHWIGGNLALQLIGGHWFECRYENVFVEPWFKTYDHALERTVTRRDISPHKGYHCMCVQKRQLSRRELRNYGLRNGPMSRGAQHSKYFESVLKTALRISAGRRFWVIGHRRLAVQIRPRVSARVAQSCRATMLSKSLLARYFPQPRMRTGKLNRRSNSVTECPCADFFRGRVGGVKDIARAIAVGNSFADSIKNRVVCITKFETVLQHECSG
jgi:hypothetical protein